MSIATSESGVIVRVIPTPLGRSNPIDGRVRLTLAQTHGAVGMRDFALRASGMSQIEWSKTRFLFPVCPFSPAFDFSSAKFSERRSAAKTGREACACIRVRAGHDRIPFCQSQRRPRVRKKKVSRGQQCDGYNVLFVAMGRDWFGGPGDFFFTAVTGDAFSSEHGPNPAGNSAMSQASGFISGQGIGTSLRSYRNHFHGLRADRQLHTHDRGFDGRVSP